jgi:DNA repair protein RadC
MVDLRVGGGEVAGGLRDLPIPERPRERLFQHGVEALSSQEILALVLGKGTKDEPVMVATQRLLSTFGSLKGVANASLEELMQIPGIGPAKAAQLKAAFELGRRVEAHSAPTEGGTIGKPEDAVAQIKSKLKNKRKEHFWVLLLDTRNRVIKTSQVSVGSLNASVVHPREVFKEAISATAASVILVHNHPSGDLQPSAEDIEITKNLARAGEVMGIEVLDHIIVSSQGHLSMKALKMI